MNSHSRTSTFHFLRLLLVVWAMLDGALWYSAFAAAPAGEPRLYFLDVGQGDSELIELPGEQNPVRILIDGGSGGAVVRELSKIFPAHDRAIDIVMMTHPEKDHFGGLIDVVREFDARVFIGNGRKRDDGQYPALIRALRARNIPYVALGEGDRLRYRDAVLSILSPSAEEFASKELNDTSIVAMLAHGGFRALYTGDIGANVERRITETYDLAAHVLKVPHHGSRFSASALFLHEVDPEVAVIGVGKNSYGHPAPQALERLKEFSRHTFRTDTEGTIRITENSGNLVIHRVP